MCEIFYNNKIHVKLLSNFYDTSKKFYYKFMTLLIFKFFKIMIIF